MEKKLVSYLVVRKEKVKGDWKIHLEPKEKNNGRKIGVNSIFPSKEKYATDTEWEPSACPEEKTPVIETGQGGVEIATFNHLAGQDCHKHLLGTEIYVVLEGEMSIRLNEAHEVKLRAGDEIVVPPKTVHEVIASDKPFLTIVHSLNCYGEQDKYVKHDGVWCQVSTLNELSKANKSN